MNYHSSRYVQDCVRSLVSPLISTVVLVDNSVDKDELVHLRALESDVRIRVLDPGANLGYGAGLNFGVASLPPGEIDYIWVLNPDTVAMDGSIEQLVACVEAGMTDLVSPLILTGRGEARIWFAGGNLDAHRGVTWHWSKGESADSVPPTLITSPFLTGAAPLLRTSTWSLLGGFPEQYFIYWEDAAWSLHAQAKGLRMHVNPLSVVWHAQGGSTGHGDGNSPAYYYYGQRNRVLVCSRLGSRWSLLLGRGARETFRLLVSPLARDTPPRGKKLSASLWGLIDGLKGIEGRTRY